MTIGELLERTRAGGVATAELTAARGGAGTVRFVGTCDFARGVTTLERVAEEDLRPMWIELAGDVVARTAGGEPEARVVDPGWAGRDAGRSAAGLLGVLDGLADVAVEPGGSVDVPTRAPVSWAQALVVHVTGIPVPRGSLHVGADDAGRLAELEVRPRRVLRRGPAVSHTLRLRDWR